MRPLVVALALLGGLAAVSRAQPAPWEREEARQEAQRALGKLREVIVESSRGNAGPAAAVQGDASWVVRLVGAVRLQVLGLPAATAAELKAAARPSLDALPADAPARTAAQAFAAQRPGQGEGEKPEPGELMRIAASVIDEEYRSGKGEAGRKRDLLEALLPFRELVPEADQAWMAVHLLRLTDESTALLDLEQKDVQAAAGTDGEPVFVWYRSNAPYLYWHPGEKRLRLDQAARAAQKPSAEFRKDTPWRPDEGPHSPARQGGGR